MGNYFGPLSLSWQQNPSGAKLLSRNLNSNARIQQHSSARPRRVESVCRQVKNVFTRLNAKYLSKCIACIVEPSCAIIVTKRKDDVALV